MKTVEAETIFVRPRRGGQGVQCPRCGSTMVETDRVVENTFLYIWYECTATGCTEQWLTKRPVSTG